jgi:hypothetical protein
MFIIVRGQGGLIYIIVRVEGDLSIYIIVSGEGSDLYLL